MVRKVPALPSNSLYLDVLETSSMEHTHSAYHTSANVALSTHTDHQPRQVGSGNSNSSESTNITSHRDHHHPRSTSMAAASAVATSLMTSPSQSTGRTASSSGVIETTTKKTTKSNKNNNNNNVKIETCMDKWYKEMKAQILVNHKKDFYFLYIVD